MTNDISFTWTHILLYALNRAELCRIPGTTQIIYKLLNCLIYEIMTKIKDLYVFSTYAIVCKYIFHSQLVEFTSVAPTDAKVLFCYPKFNLHIPRAH